MMFITVRRFELLNEANIGMVIRRIRADLVPALRAIDGYISYLIVDFRDGVFGSVGTYESEHGANLANMIAAEMTSIRFSDILTHTSMKTFKTLYEAPEGGHTEGPVDESEASQILSLASSRRPPLRHL